MEQEEKTTQLPSVLSISKFSVARGKELKVLNQALASSNVVKLAFQKLPKHMRRRAMSHNVKRLPRRLREIHMNQMTKSGLSPKQKKSSRKYRRRPYNLTSDYARRQRKCVWLNTHIWHAKRFHMIEKWGYKLPHSPCDRAFKACYRATTKHCLLQDISYYSCLEVTGNVNEIITGFNKLTDPSIDMSISAKSVIMGLRQGKCTLFTLHTKKPIGTVFFFWRPHSKVDKRTLWIWLHAAFYNEALETIVDCFCLKVYNARSKPTVYRNDSLVLTVLKQELCRFRLTGPLSNSVLWSAFKITNTEHIHDEHNSWVKSFLETTEENYLPKMRERWNNLQFISSPAEISPHIVFPLIIGDPRFNLPKKRTKALCFHSECSIDTTLWNNIFDSPLWDENSRKIAEKNKLSQAHLAKLREKLLVPGSDFEEVPRLLPLILIQRPGRRSKDYNGYGCGWDIILPSEWAQPIWLSLIMWGARSGGLREMDSVNFESGQQHFLYPDTESGKIEETLLSCKLKEDFFKLPPNKRINYNKFGITCPFSCNWQLLLREWGCTEKLASNFCVLRTKNQLTNLQDMMSRKRAVEFTPEIPENVLISVSVKFLQKGSCSKWALICLPKSEDLAMAPVEPFHEDSNAIKRKQLRQEHKELLKRLRRKRQRARKNFEKVSIDTEMLKKYSQEMRQLWVPEATVIRHSCSREVMGFVTKGDFSLLLAKTKGIGYITVGSLKKLMTETQTNTVLIRNTNARQYRLAILDVIPEV